jgi:hypothetical protein
VLCLDEHFACPVAAPRYACGCPTITSQDAGLAQG